MPRGQTTINVQRDFRAGLITEASGLNFPENACVETWDCEFDLLGRARRRLGFDLEDGYETDTIDKTLSVVTSYIWKNVTGNGLISFGVMQVGNTLYFYDLTGASVSAGMKASTVNLTTFSPSGAPVPRINECQFTDGFAKLFVVHPNLESFYVTYNEGADTFTATQIDLKIRDFEGVIDDVAFDSRPTSTLAGLSDAHEYNLRNQGWNTTVLTAWDTGRTDMPSNCDVWWQFKNSSDAFDVTTVPNVPNGNTRANKGHFILNLYDQQRDTASGVAVADVSLGTNRANVVTFHAGRVWYSGINYPGYNTNIYFSQTLESSEQFGYCYQQNDPTAEDFFDILPTDGGVIKIREAGTIYKLFPMGSALLVFAAKGVWAITGNAGLGFLANDYTISKISSHRTTTGSSFVDVNGTPMYWTTDGIFQVKVQKEDQSMPAQFGVVPMSYSTIQTFFDDIPNPNKAFARGLFNPQTQIVQWLYSSDASSTIDDNYTFDRILVYDLRTGAFYPWTISEGTPTVHGILLVDGAGANTIEYTVIDGSANNVIDALGNNVVAYGQSAATISPLFKYIVSQPFGSTFKFTVADQTDLSYLDWTTTDDDVDYDSYFIPGYQIRGQGAMKFQSPYVFFYHEGTGVFDVQGIWNYATSGNTGKYTSKQRLTFDETTYSNDMRKIKMRGNGRVLQYKITSVTGEPFNVIGWSSVQSGNVLA